MWTLSAVQIDAIFCTYNTGAYLDGKSHGIDDLNARGFVRPIESADRTIYTLSPAGQELAKEIIDTDLVIRWHKSHKNA